MGKKKLIIHDVNKSFIVNGQSVDVLKDINLEIEEGEFVVIVGHSGCGKSTLLKMIAGLETNDTGELSVDGKEISGPGMDRGMIFQEHRLFPWLSIEKNVQLGLKGLSKEEKRKLSENIEQEGPERFKEIENRVNASVQVSDTVIAPGGSVIYCEEAMQHLKSIGKVVYLKLSLDSLSKRLGNLKGRGVLLKEGQTLSDLYEERVPLYEKYADLVVDEEGKNLEESLEAVLEIIHISGK